MSEPNTLAQKIIKKEKQKFLDTFDAKNLLIDSLRRSMKRKNEYIDYLERRLKNAR